MPPPYQNSDVPITIEKLVHTCRKKKDCKPIRLSGYVKLQVHIQVCDHRQPLQPPSVPSCAHSRYTCAAANIVVLDFWVS